MAPKRHYTRLRKNSRGLHDLIDAWDPVGLLEIGAPKDEYGCLVEPILGHLVRGDTPEQLAAWLHSHIADHFGTSSPNARAFAEKACAWYRAQPAES